MTKLSIKTLSLALVFIAIFLLSADCIYASKAEPEAFSLYGAIESNVNFWGKIYTEYPSSQGVIHDKWRMDIIYGVVDLKSSDIAGSRKINRKRVKAAKAKYKAILEKLARRQPPSSPEEQHVAELFGTKAVPKDFRNAMRNLRCQVGQKDRFREGIIRSGAYIEEIKSIFRHHGLPQDLAYLPHVESSYNPGAYSKSGASGIWQFTRSTGKKFMAVGSAIDERQDPITASHAAARLLKENYQKLKNWPMAITAYNHGVAGLKRALRKKGSYEAIVTQYRSRRFRFASRNFYSEFIAAREAAMNYPDYFGDLKLDVPTPTRDIVLEGFASFPEVVHHFNLDPAAVGRLNPALRKPVLRGQRYIPKGYRLRLPAVSDGDADRLVAEIPAALYKPQPKDGQYYMVRNGDTAGKIAKAHGVKLRDLIAANNLSSNATIYVNQKIKIPLLEVQNLLIASAAIHAVKKGRNDAENSKNVESKNQPKTGLPTDLWLAAKPVVSIPAERDVFKNNLTISSVGMHNDQPVGVIQVEVEETLGHYAEWLEVPASQIRRLNKIRYGRALPLNKKIKIPLHRVTGDKFEKRRIEYHNELADNFFTAYRIERLVPYTIKKGDSIWKLTRVDFEIPLWLLKRYNSALDFGSLIPSQMLYIPIVQKTI